MFFAKFRPKVDNHLEPLFSNHEVFMETTLAQTKTIRLIVVMDDCQANDQDLAHAIYWLARQENLTVLYLVLVEDHDNGMAVTRDMATMKALTAANKLQVEVSLIEKGDWSKILRKILCPGDVVICQEELTIVNGLSKPIPVSEYLSTHLKVPVHRISGFYHPSLECPKKRLPEFIKSLGFLVILAVFTWLQIKLDLLLDGWVQYMFIITTFCIEMGVIWNWYKFTY